MRIQKLLILAALLTTCLGGAALLARVAGASPRAVRPAARDSSETPTPGESRDELGSVRAVGLMVNAPTGGGSESYPDLAFFGSFERTRVALQLRLASGGIVDLVPERSSLAAFADDQGSDLRKLNDPFGPFEMMPRISEDHRSLVFTVPSESLPSPRAQRLILRGTVAVLVATEQAKSSSNSLAVADDARFEAGPYSFGIEDTGPSEWSDGWALTLVTRRDPSTIVRYSFVAEDGTEVELDRSMSMSMGNTWKQTLETEHPLKQGRFAIEYWNNPETVLVPFDLSLGLGLQ